MKTSFEKPHSVIIVLSVIAIILSLIAIYVNSDALFGELETLSDGFKFVLFGAGLFVVGLIVGAICLDKVSKNISKPQETTNVNMINKSKVEIENKIEPVEYIARGDFVEPVKQGNDGSTDLLGQDCDKTVLLFEETSSGKLRSVDGKEIININKPEFTIGRGSEICDYTINHKNLSRAHAQIRKINNIYYISDLNSKNGTFVNGSKLLSNSPVELNDNDIIAFAKLEYGFILE